MITTIKSNDYLLTDANKTPLLSPSTEGKRMDHAQRALNRLTCSPEKKARDRIYNFDCDGCALHLRKVGSRMVGDKRYCRACLIARHDELAKIDPRYMHKVSGQHYETAEKRGRTKRSSQLSALLAWQDKRAQQKRGRL